MSAVVEVLARSRCVDLHPTIGRGWCYDCESWAIHVAAELDDIAPAREALTRVRRAQQDRRDSIVAYLPVRNVALEAHLDSIDNALGAYAIADEVTR